MFYNNLKVNQTLEINVFNVDGTLKETRGIVSTMEGRPATFRERIYYALLQFRKKINKK
jgi:hypothetical protein